MNINELTSNQELTIADIKKTERNVREVHHINEGTFYLLPLQNDVNDLQITAMVFEPNEQENSAVEFVCLCTRDNIKYALGVANQFEDRRNSAGEVVSKTTFNNVLDTSIVEQMKQDELSFMVASSPSGMIEMRSYFSDGYVKVSTGDWDGLSNDPESCHVALVHNYSLDNPTAKDNGMLSLAQEYSFDEAVLVAQELEMIDASDLPEAFALEDGAEDGMFLADLEAVAEYCPNISTENEIFQQPSMSM